MKTQDIDKSLATIDDIMTVLPQIEKAADADKWWKKVVSYLPLIVKHFGKGIRIIKNLKEIGLELLDVDSKEAEILFKKAMEKYKGDPKMEAALMYFIKGLADTKQGVLLFLEVKKEQKKLKE